MPPDDQSALPPHVQTTRPVTPAVEVEPVRKATERFRAAAAALRAEGDAGLAELVERLSQSKPGS